MEDEAGGEPTAEELGWEEREEEAKGETEDMRVERRRGGEKAREGWVCEPEVEVEGMGTAEAEEKEEDDGSAVNGSRLRSARIDALRCSCACTLAAAGMRCAVDPPAKDVGEGEGDGAERLRPPRRFPSGSAPPCTGCACTSAFCGARVGAVVGGGRGEDEVEEVGKRREEEVDEGGEAAKGSKSEMSMVDFVILMSCTSRLRVEWESWEEGARDDEGAEDGGAMGSRGSRVAGSRDCVVLLELSRPATSQVEVRGESQPLMFAPLSLIPLSAHPNSLLLPLSITQSHTRLPLDRLQRVPPPPTPSLPFPLLELSDSLSPLLTPSPPSSRVHQPLPEQR